MRAPRGIVGIIVVETTSSIDGIETRRFLDGGRQRANGRTIVDAVAAAPPVDPSVAYSEAQRQAFNELHRQATMTFSVEACVLLAVVVGCGVVLAWRCHGTNASAPSVNP